MSGRHEQGSAARTAVGLMLVLAVGLALGVGGTYYWFQSHPVPPAPVANGVPSSPSVTSPAETVPTTLPSAPAPVPVVEATPSPTEEKPRAEHVRGARTTRPAGQAVHPVTPGDAPRPPTAPVVPIAPADPRSGRRFVQGATSVESQKPIGTDLRGFDTAEVDVKRAPAVNGRLELEMEPDHVVPGQPYVVHVFLANDGSKQIEIGQMKAATLVDGKWIQVPLTPESRVIAPGKRTLLRELPGTWKATVSSWAVEVEVTSKRRDVYKNRLTWK
jgi:hypothetical protein